MNESEIFPPTKLLRYPHMFPLDIAIWERFIEQNGGQYTGFEYDVKVGTGTRPRKGMGPEYRRMQRILSKYRIDVLGHRGDMIELFEVKPNAAASAIGQVITYMELYVNDFAPQLPIKGAIVTDRERPDMRRLTDSLGMNYYVV